MHGLAQVVHKACRPWLDRIPNNLPVRIISCGLTFVFLLFTWVFFRCADLPTAFSMMERIATDFDINYALPFFGARPVYSLFLIIGYSFLFVHDRTFRLLERMFVESPWMMKLILLVVTIQLLISFSTGSIQPFIYSQF